MIIARICMATGYYFKQGENSKKRGDQCVVHISGRRAGQAFPHKREVEIFMIFIEYFLPDAAFLKRYLPVLIQ